MATATANPTATPTAITTIGAVPYIGITGEAHPPYVYKNPS